MERLVKGLREAGGARGGGEPKGRAVWGEPGSGWAAPVLEMEGVGRRLGLQMHMRPQLRS